MPIDPRTSTDSQVLDSLLVYAQQSLIAHVALLSSHRREGKMIAPSAIELFSMLASKCADLRSRRIVIHRK